MSVGSTWGCFHGAAGSCRVPPQGWTYLAAQSHLLSLQTFPEQLQLRCQLLSPFSPLSQLTSQLVYRFLTAFQHLEQEMLRVTSTTWFFLLREKQIAGYVSSRKQGEEKNGSQMFPVGFLHLLSGAHRTSTDSKHLGKLLSHLCLPDKPGRSNCWAGKEQMDRKVNPEPDGYQL